MASESQQLRGPPTGKQRDRVSQVGLHGGPSLQGFFAGLGENSREAELPGGQAPGDRGSQPRRGRRNPDEHLPLCRHPRGDLGRTHQWLRPAGIASVTDMGFRPSRARGRICKSKCQSPSAGPSSTDGCPQRCLHGHLPCITQTGPGPPLASAMDGAASPHGLPSALCRGHLTAPHPVPPQAPLTSCLASPPLWQGCPSPPTLHPPCPAQNRGS